MRLKLALALAAAPLPLSLLERRVRDWIATTKAS